MVQEVKKFEEILHNLEDNSDMDVTDLEEEIEEVLGKIKTTNSISTIN